MRAFLCIFLTLAAALTSARYVDDEWDPNLKEARQLEEVADDDLDLDADDEQLPEVQNYHEQLVVGRRGPGTWVVVGVRVILKVGKWVWRLYKFCRSMDMRICRWEERKESERSIDDQRFELRSPSDNEEFSMIGTDADFEAYNTQLNIQSLGASKVIQADLYQRRLAPKLPAHVLNSLGYEQSGVVITLEDGQRFLVVKGNQYGKGKGPALIPANKMASDWQKITSKAITRSVVSDFIAAVKPGYDVINNNGNQAAARMMQLP